LTYKRARLIYQVGFLCLFAFLLGVCTQGRLEGYPVKLFLNMSALSGLATIISQHNLASGMILAVIIAAATLFLGRFFCGWICPMGACQHFASFAFSEADKKLRYTKNTYHTSQRIKYVVLIVFLACACFGVILAGFFDPLALTTRFSVNVVAPVINLLFHGNVSQTFAFQATLLTALIFVGAFIANIRQPRFWCRTVCPLGALLSLFSVKPLFRMTRNEEKCIHCGLCHENCQGACEIDKELIPSECVMCMNCIDVCPVRAIEFRSGRSGLGQDAPTDVKHGATLTRRQFVAAAVSAFASIAVFRNLRNVKGRGFERRIRPPGTLPEDDFLARCIRCGQCMKVCPTNVIQPASAETDLEGLWTPVLKMQYGYCESDCTLCSQVCPTGAIRQITVAEKLETGYAKIGTAFIDRARCLPWSFGETCLVCQEVCPVSPKAIYYQKRKFTDPQGKTTWFEMPYVNSELCTGCGACEYNCPVQDLPAIRVTSIGEFRSAERKLTL